MATSPLTRRKKSSAKMKDLARQLSNEIGSRAEHLSEAERKRRHARLLEIANRAPK